MTPTITVFECSPDRGRGLARDMRVRWALEEIGLPYQVRGVAMEALRENAHLARQPFAQIPVYEEAGLALFESGAIVLHVAGLGTGLLPSQPQPRARAIGWMFAALNTVEPPIVEREMAGHRARGRPWFEEHRAMLDAAVDLRLRQLATWLGEADWLEGGFSAGDLLMVSVLHRVGGSPLLAAHPVLQRYLARGQARPAYRRAYAAQRRDFDRSQGH